MGSLSLAPALTPHGNLHLIESPDAPVLDADIAQRLRSAFERGSGNGLLQLGAAEAGTALPPVFSYWREFGAWYDGRGVSDRGGPGSPVAGLGRRVRRRTGGIEMRDTGLPETPESRVEP